MEMDGLGPKILVKIAGLGPHVGRPIEPWACPASKAPPFFPFGFLYLFIYGLCRFHPSVTPTSMQLTHFQLLPGLIDPQDPIYVVSRLKTFF